MRFYCYGTITVVELVAYCLHAVNTWKYTLCQCKMLTFLCDFATVTPQYFISVRKCANNGMKMMYFIDYCPHWAETLNILNSFCSWIDKVAVFKSLLKKAHQQHWGLKSDRPICNLEPTYFLYIYHLHESASDCGVQQHWDSSNESNKWPAILTRALH